MGTKCICVLFLLVLSVVCESPLLSAQVPPRKNILIVTEVGETHPAIAMVTKELATGLGSDPRYQIEFYIESLNATIFRTEESKREFTDWLVRRYHEQKPDIIVAVGPNLIAFLASGAGSIFPETPVVFCGGIREMAPSAKLDSRFTGTWLHLDAGKTIDAALRLFPRTRHIAIVAGSSAFDLEALAITRGEMKAYEDKLDLIYLTDLSMNDLLARLKQLPDNTVVLYNSLFRDAAGTLFVNATTALPMVANGAKAPVFGMADSYLGHGIVGGDLMSFTEQGRIATRIVFELLDGKKPSETPISTAPSVYMFDWKEMRRWKLKESALPAGSVVYFRQLSFWERTWWIWMISLSIILALAAFSAYLLRSRMQLRSAIDGRLQLSGMLINAEEKERSRLASELHDDFSQRLALLALGLENAAEAISLSPEDASRQLQELVNSTSEIGADLHTLSHHLHSSTLESLGLVPAVTALCKEFSRHQGIEIGLACDGVPRAVDSNVALCAFRIVQEGLRNLKKYSGVKEAVVDLKKSGHRLQVAVRDNGCGFDLRTLRQNEGLGIRSMTERARLLGGEFKIRSAPGQGTRIEAWIPFEVQGVRKMDNRDDFSTRY